MTKSTVKGARAPKNAAAAKVIADITNETPPVVAAKNNKKLVKRTNVPWRRKYYYLDPAKYEETADARKKSANQIQIMLRHMFDAKIVDAETAQMGNEICSGAIANGLNTKINPPVLFAYYRADMERLGLVFAGYNLDR